jgi:5-methylthioribose kinase
VDPFFSDAFRERWLASVWRDALGYAATKATRRIIGFAHVTDIDTLHDAVRPAAAATVLRIARRFLLERDVIEDPAAAWGVVRDEIARG